MKGIDLTVTAIILIILGLIIAVSFFIIIARSKGQVDIATAQTDLRSCCGDRSIYNCGTDATAVGRQNVRCKVSWSDQSITLEELRVQANISAERLNDFCFCGSSV